MLREGFVAWMLVEDDADIRNIISLMMTMWGENPLVFADGNAAWAWLDKVDQGIAQDVLPELALMDIRMPGPTGDKIAARIRQTGPIKNIPIVLMTAYALSEAEVKVMVEQTGIDYLMNKPLPDLDVFRQMLYDIRNKKQAK